MNDKRPGVAVDMENSRLQVGVLPARLESHDGVAQFCPQVRMFGLVRINGSDHDFDVRMWERRDGTADAELVGGEMINRLLGQRLEAEFKLKAADILGGNVTRAIPDWRHQSLELAK